jgi:hypothetical protein
MILFHVNKPYRIKPANTITGIIVQMASNLLLSAK